MKMVHFASPYSGWLNAMVLALAATICLLSVAEGRAEPAARKPAKTKRATAIRPAAPTERMEITGSRIRQRVRRIGKSVDVASPIMVLDRRELERSGAADVGDLLRRQPFLW